MRGRVFRGLDEMRRPLGSFYLTTSTYQLRNMPYYGVTFTGKDYAEQIKSRRAQYPPYVKELLRQVESHGGDTCPYYSILPQLKEVVHMEEELIDEENKHLRPSRQLRYPDSITKMLITIIEQARRNNTSINRPETDAETFARLRASINRPETDAETYERLRLRWESYNQ